MGRLFDQLKHAFALDPEPLQEKQRCQDTLPKGLVKFAEAVTARGLEVPAILFLETAQPVSFLGGQTLHALKSFIAPFFDESLIDDVADALEDRRNIPLLIGRIEMSAAEKDTTQ